MHYHVISSAMVVCCTLRPNHSSGDWRHITPLLVIAWIVLWLDTKMMFEWMWFNGPLNKWTMVHPSSDFCTLVCRGPCTIHTHLPTDLNLFLTRSDTVKKQPIWTNFTEKTSVWIKPSWQFQTIQTYPKTQHLRCPHNFSFHGLPRARTQTCCQRSPDRFLDQELGSLRNIRKKQVFPSISYHQVRYRPNTINHKYCISCSFYCLASHPLKFKFPSVSEITDNRQRL